MGIEHPAVPVLEMEGMNNMPNYMDVAKMRRQGCSQRKIASSLHMGRDKISDIFSIMDSNHLTYDQMKKLPPQELEELFNPGSAANSVYVQPDFESLSKELAAPNMTIAQLWREYTDTCLLNHQVPYRRTQFEFLLSGYLKTHNYSEIIQHKAGERCELDWVGDRPTWIDPETGEEIKGYIFVGVLPFSDFGYAEATLDMKERAWIYCNEHMFEYFGGVTPLTMIDNLKTGVVSHPWGDEAEFNKSYIAMADYYGTSVIAGKVRSPHAKPTIENFVRMIERAMAGLRNCQFFSVEEYNERLRIEVDRINGTPFTNKAGTRREKFLEFEKDLLLPLPAKPYEPFEAGRAKVNNSYHVSSGRNYYSVPYKTCNIGDYVSLRIYQDHIDIYTDNNAQFLCTHRRFSSKVIGHYDTDPAHMPPGGSRDWNKERFLRWSDVLGPNVHMMVQKIFEGGRPEQVYYDKVHAILKTADTFGASKLDRACLCCMEKSINPTVKNIKALMKADIQAETNNVNMEQDSQSAWLRGDDYYDTQKHGR